MSDPVINLDHLREWVGRNRLVEDMLAPFPAQALAAALDREDILAVGDALPAARHWLYFLETPKGSATGGDGHAKLGGFLPPVPLARRMWASGRLDFLSPLVFGQPAVRKTVVNAVEAKSGKTGSLVFVTLEHEMSQQEQLCIREEQNLVYRDMPSGPAPLASGTEEPLKADFSRIVYPDPVLLFRFSALTYNGHRIHYDRPYAMEREFYPALVVHGPLLATLLLDLLHDVLPDALVQSFSFRALRPTFDTSLLTLNGRRDGDVVTLWSADVDSQIGMSATARLA